MEVKMRYLKRDKDRHGNERIYFARPRQRKVRIHAPIGSAAFLAEYQAALNMKAEAPRSAKIAHGSLAWLCNAYMASGEYANLAESSRNTRRRVLKVLCVEDGSLPVAGLEPRHVRAMRDKKSNLPGSANQVVKVLKAMFNWAVDAGLVGSNPVAPIKKLKYRVEGFEPWTAEQLDAFEKRHPEGTKARLAFSLLYYLGVRRADAVRLGRQMEIPGNKIRFRQVKTGKWLTLPILPALRAEIDRHPDAMTYLMSERGRPFSAASFGTWFRKRCNEAGLTEVSAHGLRKTGANIAAQKLATNYELQAIFGWRSAREAEPYTAAVNQELLAAGAIHKLERK